MVFSCVSWSYKRIIFTILFLCLVIYVSYLLFPNVAHTSFLSKLVAGSSPDIKLYKTREQLCTGYGRNKSIHTYETCTKRLPNCLIIGVEKAGTFALLKFLTAHPQVVRNNSYNELYFFDRYYSKGLEWYKTEMPYSFPGQVVLEKTPSYFHRIEVPSRVFRMNPDIKLLLIVRNPVRRSISAYLMEKVFRHGFLKPFEKFVMHPSGLFEPASPFIQHSLYDFYLERWLKYFNLTQIHIVDGDLFSSDPLHELKSVERFLEIDSFFTRDMFVYNATKGFYCMHSFDSGQQRENTPCLKNSKGRKHPNISSLVIKKMEDFFRPHNLHFYNMTGRYFNWTI